MFQQASAQLTAWWSKTTSRPSELLALFRGFFAAFATDHEPDEDVEHRESSPLELLLLHAMSTALEFAWFSYCGLLLVERDRIG